MKYDNVIAMYIKTNKQKSGPTFLESLPLERFGISVTMFQDLFATLINFCDWQGKSQDMPDINTSHIYLGSSMESDTKKNSTLN